MRKWRHPVPLRDVWLYVDRFDKTGARVWELRYFNEFDQRKCRVAKHVSWSTGGHTVYHEGQSLQPIAYTRFPLALVEWRSSRSVHIHPFTRATLERLQEAARARRR